MTRQHLLTVEQAADAAGVSRRTIEAWILRKRLHVVQRRKGRVYVALGELTQLTTGICPHCGTTFKRGTLRAVYCSANCRTTAHRLSKAQGTD